MLKAVTISALLALICVSGRPVYAEESRTTIWMGPSPQVTKGAVLIERGKVAKGISVTRRAMEEDLHINDLAAAFNNLCTGDLALKLYQRALYHCNRALRLRSNMWQSYNNRANAYFGLGEWDKAIDDYIRAAKIRPDQKILAFNLHLAMEHKRLGRKPPVTERDG